MRQIGRISIGAVLAGTLLSVAFYRFTSIPITGGLASLFALIGLLVSWATFALAHVIFERRGAHSPAQVISTSQQPKELGPRDRRKSNRTTPKARGRK
jgi:hypothetical protein